MTHPSHPQNGKCRGGNKYILSINPVKYVQVLYAENYKALMKEFKGDLHILSYFVFTIRRFKMLRCQFFLSLFIGLAQSQ